MDTTTLAESGRLAPWRLKGIGLLRIVFGIVWGIDAWFKWQPGFIQGFTDYLAGAQQGQPWPVHHWIGFWINTVSLDPTVFAYSVAIGETAIAIALIIGAFTNLTAVVGSLLSVVIWSTAEGFGGPYKTGSTDIGAAIIYVLVFAGLFLSYAGLYYGVDRRLTTKLVRSALTAGPQSGSGCASRTRSADAASREHLDGCHAVGRNEDAGVWSSEVDACARAKPPAARKPSRLLLLAGRRAAGAGRRNGCVGCDSLA